MQNKENLIIAQPRFDRKGAAVRDTYRVAGGALGAKAACGVNLSHT